MDLCKLEPNSAYYVLFLIERLIEVQRLRKEHPQADSGVFEQDFEANIAQLISYNICNIEDNVLNKEQINQLIGYVNKNLVDWAVIPVEEKSAFIDKQHVSIGSSSKTSRVEKCFTMLIKVNDHTNLEHTDLKKALVDSK